MSASWIIKTFIAAFLLPPFNGLLLLCIAGVFRRRRWAMPLAATAVALLWLQSLQPVAQALIETLESRAGPILTETGGVGAIVILAGGRDRDAPEHGGDTVSTLSLERLRYGAILAKRHRLPVLTTGGSLAGEPRGEAELMADVLVRELGVAVRWIESRSDDTDDNATMSAQLLRRDGIRRIALVTHAFHMPRAKRAFERAGIEVVPAPMGFKGGRPGQRRAPAEWLPQAGAMRLSHWALHEWIGIVWYELSSGVRALAVGRIAPAGVFSSARSRESAGGDG